MKNRHLTLLIVFCLLVVDSPSVQAAELSDCTNIQPANENADSLSGLIFYFGPENFDTYDFSILNVKTLESFRFWGDEEGAYRHKGYRIMSPDGKWIIVSQSVKFTTIDDPYDFWLYSMDKQQKKFLFTGASRANNTDSWHWLDQEHLMISWFRDEGGLDAEIINPFADPISIQPIAWINAFYQKFDAWNLGAYDPVHNMALPAVPLDRSYLHTDQDPEFIYDITRQELKPIPNTANSHGFAIRSDFSKDGQLALVLSQQFDPVTQSYYFELFVSAYPHDKIVQVSHFARDLGVVHIEHGIWWSPDGKRLIMEMSVIKTPEDRYDFSNSSLYSFEVSTGKLIPLCLPFPPEYPPFVWSPDSQYIALVQDDNLIAVNVETGGLSMVRKDVYAVYGWNIDYRDK